MTIDEANKILDSDNYWDALYNSVDRVNDTDVIKLIEAMKVDEANGGIEPKKQLVKYSHDFYDPEKVIKELKPLLEN